MPLPLIALATSCRLVRCWLFTKEPEAPVDSDPSLDRQRSNFAGSESFYSLKGNMCGTAIAVLEQVPMSVAACPE
jgi:hypothetical protein